MSEDPYSHRRSLTFAQAEGAAPLPRQLELREITAELRARLWDVIYTAILRSVHRTGVHRTEYLGGDWPAVMRRHWIECEHRMIDGYTDLLSVHVRKLRPIFENGDYVAILGLTQWLLSQPERVIAKDVVGLVLKESRAAYRLLEDAPIIVPISDQLDRETVDTALRDLKESRFLGARTHLLTAANHLSTGKAADSIRESIHAVESVARVLGEARSLSGALQKLKSKRDLHPALERGFNSLYGFTSDEKGIRHPLLEDKASSVDEFDALFMIGACSAFVSYLVNRTQGKQNGSS